MTTNQPSAIDASGTHDSPPAPALPPLPRRDGLDGVPPRTNGADQSKRSAASKTSSASRRTPAGDPTSPAPILRPMQPPASQLDFDDRHDTRATESDDMARRYAALRKDRRKSDWHRLAMGLIIFVVGAVVYLAGFIVVSQMLPNLSTREAAQVVGFAFAAAGGGVAAEAAGRALTTRRRNRGRGSNGSNSA